MEQTANYGLNQWDAGDRILREDFNADNARVDAALAEQGAELATHAAQLALLGNAAVYNESFKGTGTTTVTRTFPGKPVAIIVGSTTGYQFVASRGMEQAYPHYSNGMVTVSLTWGDRSITWSGSSSSNAMNSGNSTYHIAVLLDMSA